MIEKRFSIGRIQRKAKRIKRMIIVGIVVLVLLIVWGFYMVAQLPYREAKSEAFQMVVKYAKVDNIENFYIYNRNSTYYTIEGKIIITKMYMWLFRKKGIRLISTKRVRESHRKRMKIRSSKNISPKISWKLSLEWKMGGEPHCGKLLIKIKKVIFVMLKFHSNFIQKRTGVIKHYQYVSNDNDTIKKIVYN